MRMWFSPLRLGREGRMLMAWTLRIGSVALTDALRAGGPAGARPHPTQRGHSEARCCMEDTGQTSRRTAALRLPLSGHSGTGKGSGGPLYGREADIVRRLEMALLVHIRTRDHCPGELSRDPRLKPGRRYGALLPPRLLCRRWAVH